jgi:hypothetical protein
MGLTITLIGLGVLLVAAVWLVGFAEAWVALFTVIAGLGAVGLAAWSMGVAVVLAAISYLILRRTIP